MKSLAIILTTLAWFSFTKGYIHNIIHKKGYCIWYDECLASSHAALNCLYNGPAKRLNDTHGITLLNKLCPKFSQKQMTCCSTKQLETMETTLSLLRSISRPCPTCWQNILDMFCEMTCSPDQSLILYPTQTVGLPPVLSILKVQFYVSMNFKTGLFESCKDVLIVDENYPLQYFLEALGSYFHFDILFPEILPSNMTRLNDSTYSCNQSFVNPWTNKTFDKCNCMYCSSSCSNETRRDPYDSPDYFKAVLKITANSTYPQNHTGYYRYPDDKFIPFGPIFHLDLLNQALDLQLALTNMKVPYSMKKSTVNITFDDVCYKPPSSNTCVIESVFQYFQNNKTHLNRCVTALGQKCGSDPTDYVEADYHDHFLYCTRFPFSPNDKKWGGSCLGENGLLLGPRFVLSGFNDSDYNMAKYLVISFVFKNHTEKSKNEMAQAWEKAFLSYMMEYIHNPRHSNLTMTFSAATSSVHEKSTRSPATTVPDVHSGNLRVSSALGQLLFIMLASVMLSPFILE